MHDSEKLDAMLDLCNTGKAFWADRAYHSAQIEAGLKAKGLHPYPLGAAHNRPLSERQKSANTARSKVRARVEHVFGHQQNRIWHRELDETAMNFRAESPKNYHAIQEA